MKRIRTLPLRVTRGKDTCPQCGSPKMKRSSLCLECGKQEKYAKDECGCGNQKLKSMPFCRKCSFKSENRPNSKNECPNCGSTKNHRSKLCRSCSDHELRQRPCPRCGKPFNEDDFNIRPNGRRKGPCKECTAKEARAWRKSHPEENRKRKKDHYWKHIDKNRAKGRIRRWVQNGYSKDELENTLNNHPGKCDICGSKQPGGKGTFKIDHDHKTGTIRGLLCNSCNLGISHFKDDPNIMLRAIRYLKKERGNNGHNGENNNK